MVLKFASNLNFLFTEGAPSLGDKIRWASRAGFRAVEIPFPQEDATDVIKAKEETGVEISLINISLDLQNYKFGVASIPGAEELFKQHLAETVEFAKSVNCKKIHLMSGLTKEDNESNYLDTYKNNLRYAATVLQKENIVGVIEPINNYAVPYYFMNCYEKASSVLREIQSKNLKLMVDIYHMQHIRGNLTNAFSEMSDIIGHIQIAQVPHRNEPHVAGELDYAYIFSLIEKSGYDDWIGCEYKPMTTTMEGLKWVSKYGFKL